MIIKLNQMNEIISNSSYIYIWRWEEGGGGGGGEGMLMETNGNFARGRECGRCFPPCRRFVAKNSLEDAVHRWR